MPRNYTDENLAMAVNAVREGGLSIREAERTYSVPFNTIRRRVNGSVDMHCKRPGPQPFLGTECEKEIYEAVVQLQKIGHGLSRKEILKLAGEIDAKREVKVFKNALPSKRWYKSFMMRHNLTLRQPENLSAARNSMATEKTKEEFFEKLTEVIQELKITGCDIYNVDETGLTMVNKGGKIVAPKGSKTVVMRKSGERSENVTVVVACNATASIILPPMVIYKGTRLNEDLMKGAPDDTIFASSPKGYIDSELFYTWFVKFVAALPPRRPVLLLLDGHASHLSRETLILARENYVHFLMFPPHTTHIFQPLDVGVFGPLKKSFSEECTKLMRKNKRKYLNRYDFCKVLTPAWQRAITPANILGGFRGSGVWPLDPSAVHAHRLMDRNDLNPVPARQDGEPQPGCSSNDSGNSPVSPVVQVIKELLAPEEHNTTRSRRITTTRCVTSLEFLREMEGNEKKKKKSTKRRRVETSSESSEDDDDENDSNTCGECGGAFEDDCRGESWIQCIKCKLWYHQTCQNLSNKAQPKRFLCASCKK